MDSTIVIKVKHAKTLRRFNVRVVNNGLELTLEGLRNKIRGLLNFSPDADLVLTYVDEDNDKVTLGDDEDLRDIVRQALNPLRISVSLRTDEVARTPSESGSVARPPVRTIESSPVQHPAQNAFENLNSSFTEFINTLPEPITKNVINSLPEPVMKGVTKILSDLTSTSTSPGLSELVRILTEKGFPFPGQLTGSGASTDSSAPASAPATKDASNLAGAQEAGSSNVQKSELELLSKEKSVKLPSEAVTEAYSAPSAPRNQVTKPNEAVKSGGSKAVAESWFLAKSNGVPQVIFTNEVVKSGGLKNSAGQKAEKKDAQKEKAISEETGSAGKATTNSSPVVGVAPTISHPMFSLKKKEFTLPWASKPVEVVDVPSVKAKQSCLSPSMPKPDSYPLVDVDSFKKHTELPKSVQGSIPLVNSDSFKKHTEPSKPVQGLPFPAAPGFQTWNKAQPNTFNYNPSSTAPQCPFIGTPSIGGRWDHYGYGGNNSGTLFHRGVRCDGCGVHPITGTRFKSLVKDDYDLCTFCFAQMGVESDYMRIERPEPYHNPTPFGPRMLRPPHASSAFNSYCGTNLSRPKLDSRFIQDVTILDNALMAPSTPFTKIWRMRNNGSLEWPIGTKLVWIGGDKMGDVFSVDLEIESSIGFPVDQELDVAVDFVAPSRPGRYVSYWRMRSPTGQKFGQRVWVLIQVDATLTAVQQALRDFNLNQMPSNTPVGSAPEEEVLEDAEQKADFDLSTEKKGDTVFPPVKDNLLAVGSGVSNAQQQQQPASSSSASSTHPPAREWYPMIDLSDASFPALPSIGTTSTFVAPAFNNESDQKKTSTEESNVEAVPVVAAVPFPAAPEVLVEDYVSSDDDEEEEEEQRVVKGEEKGGEVEEENELEKSLLMELDRMGFKEVALNKEILRSNKYDLEKVLNDLCGDSEWDPILEELHEMGFHDDVMNKKLLEKNNGSVTQVVLDLLVEEGQ